MTDLPRIIRYVHTYLTLCGTVVPFEFIRIHTLRYADFLAGALSDLT